LKIEVVCWVNSYPDHRQSCESSFVWAERELWWLSGIRQQVLKRTMMNLDETVEDRPDEPWWDKRTKSDREFEFDRDQFGLVWLVAICRKSRRAAALAAAWSSHPEWNWKRSFQKKETAQELQVNAKTKTKES
jgi:hypothetical protein